MSWKEARKSKSAFFLSTKIAERKIDNSSCLHNLPSFHMKVARYQMVYSRIVKKDRGKSCFSKLDKIHLINNGRYLCNKQRDKTIWEGKNINIIIMFTKFAGLKDL